MRKYLTILTLFVSIMLTAQDINFSNNKRNIPDGYLNYEEINEYIDNLELQNQDIMSIIDFGFSQQNQQILKAVKIGNNTVGSRNLLFLSGIRANDLSNIYLNMRLLENLLDMKLDEPYVSWLENVNFYFIITLNPDGLDAVIEHSLPEFQNNLRDINQNSQFDPLYDGVDLYYNYDCNWVHGNDYNDNQQGSLNYRGNSAYSESETQSLLSFLEEYSIHSALIFNNVSESKKLIFPYNWLGLRESADYDNLLPVANNIAGSLSNDWQTYGQDERNGNIQDWLFVNRSISSFMLSNSDFQQIPEISLVDSELDNYIQAFNSFTINTSQESFNANVGRLDLTVINAETQEPESVYYQITESWSDAYHNHKTGIDGKIVRFLNPGTYTLRLFKNGFKTVSMTDVVISENSVNVLDLSVNALSTASFSGSVSIEGMPVSGKIIIDNTKPDTLYFNSTFSIEYYQGIHEITIIPDETFLMPFKQQIILTEMGLSLHFELTQTMILLEETFDGACCNWIFNGPWTVVYDSLQNSGVLADSWSWLNFYNSDADISVSTIFPLSLSSFVGRQAYLEFDSFSHTEWDNDYISVELIEPSSEPVKVWSRAGKYDSWERITLDVTEFLDRDFYISFRLKDGIEANPNHAKFTDPGWRIDNIRFKVGIYTTSEYDEVIPEIVKNKLDIYPNPFNPMTNIKFSIKGMDKQKTSLNIYNVKGQLVKSEEFQPATGDFIIYNFKSDNLSSGIYFINIKNNENNLTKKALLLK